MGRKQKLQLKQEIAEVGDGFHLGTLALSKMLGVSRATMNNQFAAGKVVGAFKIGDLWKVSVFDALRNWPSLGQIGGPLRKYAVRNGLVDRLPAVKIEDAMEVGG